MSDHYHMTSAIKDSDREAWNIPIKTHMMRSIVSSFHCLPCFENIFHFYFVLTLYLIYKYMHIQFYFHVKFIM